MLGLPKGYYKLKPTDVMERGDLYTTRQTTQFDIVQGLAGRRPLDYFFLTAYRKIPTTPRGNPICPAQ